MKNLVGSSACPKCHGSGMSFVTEQKSDGFAVTAIRCDCIGAVTLPLPTHQSATPVFL